jgi:hypothetical protein
MSKKSIRQNERRRRLYQAKKKAGLLDRRSTAQRAADKLELEKWKSEEQKFWIKPKKMGWRLKGKRKK